MIKFLITYNVFIKIMLVLYHIIVFVSMVDKILLAVYINVETALKMTKKIFFKKIEKKY